MKLTLAQLETFCWIVRLGTFQAAARRQNLAQPTVSLRIRELEAALGTTLLRRRGRRVQPTAEGSALLQDAERILALAEGLEARGGRGRPLRGLVRLGAPESFALTCLPQLIPELARAHPELQIETVIETSSDLLGLLGRHRLDLAVLATAGPGGSALERRGAFRIAPLGRQELAWVSGPGRGFAAPLRPADLAGEPIVTTPPATPLHETLLAWFRGAGIEPTRVSYCNSLSVIARLTAAGLGIGVLPPAILRRELADGALHVLACAPRLPAVSMSAVHPEDGGGPALDAVVEAIRRSIAETGFLDSPET